MTDREELEWVARLGLTRERQIAVLRDLLRHARNDEMSGADVAICRKHLTRLYLVDRTSGVTTSRACDA